MNAAGFNAKWDARPSSLNWLAGLFLLAPVGLWGLVTAGWLALPAALPGPGQLAILLIAAPIIEEFVFRGNLQPWTANWLGERLTDRLDGKLKAQLAAILVTSLVFAALHWLASGAGASGWVLLPSLALGWLQVKTHNWKLCALLHSGFNAVWCAAIWLQ